LPLEAPEVEIPEEHERDWRIYFDVSNCVSRIKEGYCSRIPPSEWFAWKTLSGVEFDYETMRIMDTAFCQQMNIELDELRQSGEKKQ